MKRFLKTQKDFLSHFGNALGVCISLSIVVAYVLWKVGWIELTNQMAVAIIVGWLIFGLISLVIIMMIRWKKHKH